MNRTTTAKQVARKVRVSKPIGGLRKVKAIGGEGLQRWKKPIGGEGLQRWVPPLTKEDMVRFRDSLSPPLPPLTKEDMVRFSGVSPHPKPIGGKYPPLKRLPPPDLSRLKTEEVQELLRLSELVQPGRKVLASDAQRYNELVAKLWGVELPYFLESPEYTPKPVRRRPTPKRRHRKGATRRKRLSPYEYATTMKGFRP